MARKLDTLLVIDLEATCWQEDPPPGQTNEIIEIGLCELDVQTSKRKTRRSIFVKPEHSELSEFCIQLTGITPNMLADALSYSDACAVLEAEYLSHQRTWASYGDYDRRQFAKQCQAMEVAYPFGPSHINVKNLLALQLGLKHEVNLVEAMHLLGLAFEGRVHRGGDDAWNIAAVLQRVLLAGHRQE
jgi:inhibitor of KinA sporulation pathway (predicted exonuclease)